jgi:hypothetical protein
MPCQQRTKFRSVTRNQLREVPLTSKKSQNIILTLIAEDSKAEDLAELKCETTENGDSVAISESSTTRTTMGSEEEVFPTIVPRAEQPPLRLAGATLNNSSLQRILNDLAGPEKPLAEISSHQFWSTQPVPKYGEVKTEIQEGPIMEINQAQVATKPSSLLAGFEWVTMDLTKKEELTEVFELLSEHYVEDEDSEFRLNYSPYFLKW